MVKREFLAKVVTRHLNRRACHHVATMGEQ
jgi:hypothetical protein